MADPRPIAPAPRVTVAPLPHAAFGVLRLGRGVDPETLAAIGAALGLALPQVANRAVGRTPRVLWTAPLEWTLIDASPAQLAALESACAGVLSHYADLTGGRVGLRIVGEDARNLIATECPLDLSAPAFPPGCCAQSLFAGVPILIDRPDGEDGLRLYVDVSLADHLTAWLAAAAEGLA